MKSTLVLLAFATFAAFAPLHAGERFVTSGADYDVNDPIIPNTLRGELELAQSGDTIHIARNLIVNLFDRLIIPAGKNNLTITGPDEGPAQIRAIIERGENSQNNSILVQGDNVTFRKLTVRDIALTFGDANLSVFVVQGGTVRDCSFTQRSNLTFANMNNGLAEMCVLNVAPFEAGAAAIDVLGGNGTVVRKCQITLLGSAGSEDALGADGGTNVRFEDNTLTNGDLSFWAKSGWVIDNKLPNRALTLVLANPLLGPGPYEFVGNECGAIVVKARNFSVRENIVSGRVTGRRPPGFQVVGGDPLEKEAPISLQLFAFGDAQPIEVENNTINGGTNGVVLEVRSTGGATFSGNTIRNVKMQGMILDAESPVQLEFNLFEKCGNTTRAPFGPYPTPALHLRNINEAVTVKQNTLRNCRGVAILGRDGSPVFDTNLISGGVAAGMLFYDAVTPVFTGVNRIERMARGGVVVKAGANITVEGVTFEQNGTGGLCIEAGATATSRNNTFTAQIGPGIRLAPASKTPTATLNARARVDGGTFTLNKGAGVLVGKDGSCEIVGGAFVDNLGAGIDLVPAGVSVNIRPKLANGGINYPEQLTFDEATRVLRGKAEPGALVQMYRVEKNKRRGNPKNGEGAMFVSATTATGEGDFALAPGPTVEGDMFTFTATRPATGVIAVATSEFSENIEVPPSPPVELISQSSNEEVGNGASMVNFVDGPAPQVLQANTSVSTDGRFVLFHSEATNLVNDDTNDQPDLFLRDRASGTTERVNVATGGAQAGPNFAGSPASVGNGSLSADGRWVVFTSNSENLVAEDLNSGADVFLRDRQTGTTIAVSEPHEHPDMSGRSGGWDCSISADGSVVVFATRDNRFTGVGTDGQLHLLVWTRSTAQFEEVNPPQPPNTGFFAPRLSADGRFVAFETNALLVAEDTGLIDVYLRDRQTGAIERISVATDGAALGGSNAAISPDGRFVAFATAASGDPADTNGQSDIYVRDRQLGTTTWASQQPAILPHTHFGRDGKYPSISADGRYVSYQAFGLTTREGEATFLVQDVFVRDRQLGVTIEANVGELGDVRGESRFAVMSPDGRQVIFEGRGQGFYPGDAQPQGEVFARALTPEDFAAP